MADLEILSLDTVTPQIRAPGTGNAYAAPRTIKITPEVGTAHIDPHATNSAYLREVHAMKARIAAGLAGLGGVAWAVHHFL